MTDNSDRKDWLSILAKAPADVLAQLWQDPGDQPRTWLRAPEVGGVMVRARSGGTGAPFNLGEMTVTRASVQLGDGRVGHGYVQGRDKAHAQSAALIDALMQGPEATTLRAQVIAPLRAHLDGVRQTRAEKAAATKVDFFTMVRGED